LLLKYVQIVQKIEIQNAFKPQKNIQLQLESFHMGNIDITDYVGQGCHILCTLILIGSGPGSSPATSA